MSKFFKSLLLLLTAGLFTATGWAAAPIAMWSNFSTTKSGNYTFNKDDNAVAEGVLTIGSTPSRLESSSQWLPSATDSALVIAMKVSNLKVAAQHQTLISVNKNNRFGITLNSDGNFYALYNTGGEGTYNNENRKSNNSSDSKGCLNEVDSASKTYIIVFKYQRNDGTYAWLYDVETDSVKECVKDTGCKDGTSVGSLVCLGASYGPGYPAKNLKIYNVAIWDKNIDASEAIETIKALGETVNASRTISGETYWKTEASWNPSMPTTGSSATLTAAGEVKLTMDESVILQNLSVVEDGDANTQDKLTIATDGTSKLTAITSTINTDTTVNAGAASLGAVTLAGEKTLTVKGAAVFTSLAGAGTLNLDVGESTPLENYALNAFSGTTKISSGTLKYTNSSNRPAGPILVSGETAALQIATNHDILGYSGGLPGITIENGARFEAFRRDTFSRVLTLNNGELVFSADDQHSGRSFDLYDNSKIVSSGASTIGGKTATNDADSGDPIVASGIIAIRRSDLEVDVTDGILNVYSCIGTAPGYGGSVYKKGAGTLAVYRAATSALPVVVEAGELRLVRNGTLTTGTMTVNANATLRLVDASTSAVTLASNATLAGTGTINGALTFNEGAILDATAGAITAKGDVVLEDALTVKGVTLSDYSSMERVLKKTYQLAEGVEEATSTEVTIGTSSDYYLVKKADGLYVKAKTVKDTLEATMLADKNKLSDFFDAKTEVLSADTILTIDFGSEDGEAGTFTFDTDNTGAVSIAQIIVKGTNGGTITKTGAGTVSATATTIQKGCSVTVPANTARFGAVAIEQDATLKVADKTTVTSVTGEGVLETSVFLNESNGNSGTFDAGCTIVGLNTNTWSGTFRFKWNGVHDQTGINLSLFGNAKSTIEIAEDTTLSGYLTNSTWSVSSSFVLNGKLEIRDGFGSQKYTFDGPLTGSGEFCINSSGGGTVADTMYFQEDGLSEFKGTIKLQKAGRAIVIGDAEREAGKIVIAKPVTIPTGKTWMATNGISVTGEGTIAGAGTLSIPSGKALTYNSTASSTFEGKIAGEGGLAVSSGTLELQSMSDFRGAVNLTGGKLVFNNTKPGDYTNDQNERIPNNTVILFKSGDASITVGESATVELKAGVIYRKFLGTGNILVAGDFTMGGTGGDTPTMTDGFKGTITVDKGVTLTLLNWNSTATVFDASKLIVNGSIEKTQNAVTATVAALSGSGTINIPVSLADGATIVAPTVEEQFLTVTGTATVNGTATMTGNFKVAGLGGTGTLAVANNAMGSLTVTGTSTFGGSLNGVDLVVANGANLTLAANSTVSTIAGEGTLTVQGATLTVNSESSYAGIVTVQGNGAKLSLTDSFTLTEGAKLMVGVNASLRSALMDKELVVTVNSGATLMRNAGILSTNLILNGGAILDYTEVQSGEVATVDVIGRLSLNATSDDKIVLKGLAIDYVGGFLACAKDSDEPWTGNEKNLFVFQAADGTPFTPNNRFTMALTGVEIIKATLGLTKVADEISTTIPEEILDEICGLVLGAEWFEISEIKWSNRAECFKDYTLSCEPNDTSIITICSNFGVSDVKILDYVVNNETTQQVAIAVKVSDGGYGWGEESASPAYLREGTKVHLSVSDAAFAEATPLSADELVAAGLATETTKADVYAGKSGVYWFWAGALPEIPTVPDGQVQPTSVTHHYKVKAVNTTYDSQPTPSAQQ